MLEETVKAYEGRWGSFEFAELKGEPEDFNDSLFRDQINTLMDARRNDVSDQTTWEKCRHAVQCAFTAFSPFAKNFLTIMKEGQAVRVIPRLSHLQIPALNPYGLLCGGLLLLIVVKSPVWISDNIDCRQRDRPKARARQNIGIPVSSIRTSRIGECSAR